MRDAKRDLLRLKNLKQTTRYVCDSDFNWLVNTLRRYINGWVEGREIGMELVEKLNQAEAREGEMRGLLQDLIDHVPLIDHKTALVGTYLPVQTIQKARQALSLSRPAILERMERMEKALREVIDLHYKPTEGGSEIYQITERSIRLVHAARIAKQALEGSEAAFDPPQLDSRDTTTLIYDEQYDNWECAKCDMVWHFDADGPKENKINYCPECGRKIVALEGGDPK
jgi:hypothetical protein